VERESLYERFTTARPAGRLIRTGDHSSTVPTPHSTVHLAFYPAPIASVNQIEAQRVHDITFFPPLPNRRLNRGPTDPSPTGRSPNMVSIPKYDDLPIKPEYPAHSAWGVWGEDDELGTLVSPSTAASAF